MLPKPFPQDDNIQGGESPDYWPFLPGRLVKLNDPCWPVLNFEWASSVRNQVGSGSSAYSSASVEPFYIFSVLLFTSLVESQPESNHSEILTLERFGCGSCGILCLIYLIFGCAGSSLLCSGFLQLRWAGATWVAVHRHLLTVAPPVAEQGLQARGLQWLQCTGLVALRHAESSQSRDQTCSPHWQADS